MQLNECEYKYKLIESQNKNVYINQRYHNGLTTHFAFMTFEDNDFKRTYLPPTYENDENYLKLSIHLRRELTSV